MYLISPVNISVIDPPRKIWCTAACAIVLAAAGGAPAGARAGGPELERAKLSQAGRNLVFSLRTSTPVALSRLDPLPRPLNSRHLCLALRSGAHKGTRQVCIGGDTAHRRAGLELLGGHGKVSSKRLIRVRLKRPSADKLVLSLLPGDAGLDPSRYRWRVLADFGHCGAVATECRQSIPRNGERIFRLRPVRPVGCTGGNAGLTTNGPRGRRAVALTFDDGPSEYTPDFLDVLHRKHARGTFFEIGQEMAGRESTMRRILLEGSEIGNHTTHHTEYPDHGDIAPTTSLIESIARFRPCLFRPPGGGVDSAVLVAAGEDRLRTVTWDVDPADWTNPGSAAVYSRVVGAVQPGSIVLMHDGGGPRGGTLAALPAIIDTLRNRGYRFETVTELLGERMIYRPYG